MPEIARSVRAPEFPPGPAWLNVDRPLALEDLRGKIVLLDFWTYCCINCMHVLPDLRRLARTFAAELVVIGVHSAKFDQEKQTENIRRAIRRYEITHPVVNDRDFLIWNAYAVHGWPTLFLIDPDGMIHASASGEGVYEPLEKTIRALIEKFEHLGRLNRRPIAGIHPEHSGAALAGSRAEGLLFPGKVLGDEEGGRLFVADSGRHRILEADLFSGTVRRIIGSGTPGLIDGCFRKARFRNPQGMALRGSVLLVADTGNHAIREIDLEREVVRTLAGTGEQSRVPGRYGVRWPGREIALSSPWDLALVGETLYVAMAGCHQIWRLDPELEEMAFHAGSGQEGLSDGPHAEAALAQPSGITTDRKRLFFADSEASAIRSAGLGSDGEVTTLVGQGLFEFGLRDGIGDSARLQHPLGVVWHGGMLYVADTYNNAVRALDPVSRNLRTLLGTGSRDEPAGAPSAGLSDPGAVPLYEPGGITVGGEHLFVADTNHHRVLRLHMEDGSPTDWQLNFPEKLNEPAAEVEVPGFSEEQEPERVLKEAVLSPGLGHFHFDLRLPAGYALNRTAPFELSAEGDGTSVDVLGGPYQLHTGDPSFPITIPLQLCPGGGFLSLVVVLYYCEEPGERFCFYQSLRLRAPITVSEGAKPEARVLFQVEVPSGPI